MKKMRKNKLFELFIFALCIVFFVNFITLHNLTLFTNVCMLWEISIAVT